MVNIVIILIRKTGALYTNVWVGKYYVNDSGRRTGQTRPDVKVNDNRYTYKSSSLNIDLRRKSTHNVPYWVALIKIKKFRTAEIRFILWNLWWCQTDYLRCGFW